MQALLPTMRPLRSSASTSAPTCTRPLGPSRPAHLRPPTPARRAPAPAAAARLAPVCAAAASTSYADAEAVPVVGADGAPARLPATPGVYAVSDAAGALQYVGVSRKVAVSVATHLESMPELVHSVKVLQLPDAGKEELTEAWREWVQEAGEHAAAVAAAAVGVGVHAACACGGGQAADFQGCLGLACAVLLLLPLPPAV